MRILIPTLCLLLVACGNRPAGDATSDASPPTATPPVTVPSLSPAPAQRLASPVLQVATLDDPATDSPFRFDPIEPGPPRTRRDGGVLWAPAASVVHALRPGAVAQVVDGALQVDGVAIDVPTRVEAGDTWIPVPALALALGGYARTHPDDGSVTLWPAPALAWLRANGDPNAPVLLEARAAGVGGLPLVATTTAQLRIRNDGPAAVQRLEVRFPGTDVAFGDVGVGATTAYRAVPGGVYNYAAYRARIDGRDVDVPVIDWVGESPMPADKVTYVIAVDPAADLPVRLVRAQRD